MSFRILRHVESGNFFQASVAQSDRAPHYGCGGSGFESSRTRELWPGDEMEAITDLSPVGPQAHAGSIPARATEKMNNGEAAQTVDGHLTVNPAQ